MKKVGIITFHKAHNYGAMLQAFALEESLKKENDVEIIDYYNHKVYDWYKVIRPFKKNIIKGCYNVAKDIIRIKKKSKRYNSFDKFINEKCNLSTTCFSKEDVENISKEYDVVITGSDQVWNRDIVVELSDVYTLNFKNDNIRKISYAASIGDVTSIKNNEEEFKNKIQKLNNISVREQDAKDELSKIINKKIEVVLDPTLLLTKNEWEKEIKDIKSVEEKYILAYVVEADEEYIKIVNDLSSKTGLKIIHFGAKNPGYKNVLKCAYTEGPLEFVNYIKNAEYVVATSFHATVFSIIFNKKFFIIPHKKNRS